MSRSAFLDFLERLSAHSVEHISSADKLTPRVVIAVRYRVMTQVEFRTAGVGGTIFRLFRSCLHIGFHVWIRICYVTDLVRLKKNFWGALMCGSSLPPLKSQTVLEFLVTWMAPHYCSRRKDWLIIVILPRT